MKRFQNWLESRDGKLVEELSAEEMEKHGLDALKYAQSTVQKKREQKERMQAMQDLQKIITSLESWVGDGEDMSLRVKALAAVLHLQDNDEDWVGDFAMGSLLPHSVVEGMAKIKDLESMAKYFSHDNIMRHIGNGNALHDLTSLIGSDFKREIMPLVKKRPEISQDHGEIGKHFSEFVVSHMTHAAKTLLSKLKSDQEKPEPQKPESPTPTPAPAQPVGQPTSEPSGVAPSVGQ